MTAATARTYDRWARHYDRRWRRYMEITLGVLLDHLVLDGAHDILDVGCGTGALLARLRVQAPRAHLLGVDVSPGMLRMARAKLEGAAVDLRHGTVYHLPVDDQSVDVVTMASVVHYLKRPSVACAEVRRVLRPGGTLAMVDYLPRGGWGSAMDGVIRLCDRGHVRGRDMGETQAMVRWASLTVTQARGFAINRLCQGIVVTASAAQEW